MIHKPIDSAIKNKLICDRINLSHIIEFYFKKRGKFQ
jgi:hypothetical protein